jgi:hypothetical protein
MGLTTHIVIPNCHETRKGGQGPTLGCSAIDDGDDEPDGPVTVAVRSEAWALADWLLRSWVRIPLKAWMFVRVFLCCVVLYR